VVVVLLIVALLLIDCANALPSPMLYKRNPGDKFEADLVAVSSTVIPLTVLEVSYGLGGKPSDAYKAAYLRKLRKQVQQREEAESEIGAADTLITGKQHAL
ncbi:hypothetical protein KR093_007733, partial [Drosophila rubida]